VWPWAGTPATPAQGKQAAGRPQCVLILRHAEKPKKEDGGIHLTSRGAARAAALPSLFPIPPTFPTKPAPFPRPDFLFAAAKSDNSNRPVETVEPLARALGDLRINHKHPDHDYKAVVKHLFEDPRYAGKTVLICWHHGQIPHLTRAILKQATNADKLKDQVPDWDDAIFDRVWQITFDEQARATYANHPQRLLFGDKAE
jgi:hypothetical protein